MLFIPVGPLPQLLRYTRYSLFFQRFQPQHPAHKTHKLLLFRLASAHGAAPEFYSMESKCPHLGADLGKADVEDLVVTCPWHHYDFDLTTGDSSTGMRLCTYKVEVRDDVVHVESPGEEGETEWELVKYEPVSEAFADLPAPKIQPSTSVEAPLSPPSLASLSLHPDLPERIARPTTILAYALLILRTANPTRKVALTREALAFIRSTETSRTPMVSQEEAEWSWKEVGMETPPREDNMKSVAPGRVGKRGKGGSEKSRSLMLHALANIEQWAIDLAWDIIARFARCEINGAVLPDDFIRDWAKVAEDEAKHFSLLVALLDQRGVQYGDHTVHAGLWDSAIETAHSLRSRLAIVAMVHEARGLDVNPVTIAKFRKAGDLEAVAALEIIHNDEVTHVTAGHKWFSWVCEQQGVDPIQAFRKEVRTHFRGKLKGPFNEVDRLAAGMTPDFYQELEGKGYDSDEEVKEREQARAATMEEIHPRLT